MRSNIGDAVLANGNKRDDVKITALTDPVAEPVVSLTTETRFDESLWQIFLQFILWT